jgi:ribose transport system substrate-binding protein
MKTQNPHWFSRTPRVVAVASVAMLALAIAGCGSSSKTSSSSAGAGGSGSTQASSAASSGSGHKYTIGLASEGLNAPFPVAIAKGVTAAAAKDGVKAIVLDGKLSETTQESDIRTLIAEHVNGIIIDVIDPGPTIAMIKQAQAAHIRVMLVHGYAGTKASPAYPGVAYEVDENETRAGAQAGQLALKADPSGGQVAIITGTPGYNAVTQRENGFTSVTKPTGKYQIVATQSGNWIATGGYSACASILQAHPKISLIYAEADDMAIGCAKAEKAASSKAPIVSIGGEQEVKGLMKEHVVAGTVCYEPETEGQIVMDAMYKQLSGKAHYNGNVDFYATPTVTTANLSSCGYQW